MQPKFTLKKTGRLLGTIPIFMGLLFLLSGKVSAQSTTLNSTGTNYASEGGFVNFFTGNTAVTFVIENTNSYPITVNKIESYYAPAAGITSGTATLWFSSTSLSGAPTIGSPAWTSIATGSNVTIGAAG